MSIAETTTTEGISVNGEAVIQTAPELATFVFGVYTTTPNAAQAIQTNAQQTQRIVQALFARGLSQNDLQTLQLSLTPLFKPANQSLGLQAVPSFSTMTGIFNDAAVDPTSVVGFGVRNLMKVKVHDLRRLGEVVDTAIVAGANILQNLTFELRDEAALRRSALEAAARDARQKAEGLANTVGRQIGDVVSISEGFSFRPLGAMIGGFAGQSLGASPMAPGELDVRAQVHVVYSFR
jgi:uncharacterized protein